ncbi:COX15/CtaA family protein [Parvularcula maris]|uniref:Heme A synthase n=1 Tax=Parvularcula maris TaxID=2965077 RepID=A0A9X2RJJ1_9PROT|nr:COX15/CtaA family protein [Parvularcula maris]MCQ8185896.1 COX15/CtaA family protein [Parvularcula maris]
MELQNPNRPVAFWLLTMAGLIALMVIVGGATRLTDSGLSITQWDLVMGTLPPLSEADWQEAFALYKEIPEYERVNRGMSLEEFKFIFWWEWGHRNLGRFIGLAFLIPLAVFWATGRMRGRLRWRLVGLFLLICLQGAIGWYMVSSGLSERVDVSQYRLALHLSTALLLFSLVIWQALALLRPRGFRMSDPKLGRLAGLFLGAASVQIVLGAFVAGLRAGSSYNTWPLMDGRVVPEGYFGASPQLADLFERTQAVQFNHRLMAFVVVAAAALFVVRAVQQKRLLEAGLIGGSTLLQFALGIVALVTAVPLWLGLAHQAGALLVLAGGVFSLYALSDPRRREAPEAPPRAAPALQS